MLFGFAFYTSITGPSLQELIIADDLAENFNAKVESLYYDKRNHNVKYATFKNGQKYAVFRNWERYIEVGDSLSKQKESFFLEIYKKNNEKMILDYRDTYKKEK
ncbi:hypothetical protein D3C86_2023310 [compost metagenome]